MRKIKDITKAFSALGKIHRDNIKDKEINRITGKQSRVSPLIHSLLHFFLPPVFRYHFKITESGNGKQKHLLTTSVTCLCSVLDYLDFFLLRDELNSSPRESLLLQKLRCVPRKHFKWVEGKVRKGKKRVEGKIEHPEDVGFKEDNRDLQIKEANKERGKFVTLDKGDISDPQNYAKK